MGLLNLRLQMVSVAGCLGYDVLELNRGGTASKLEGFSCWLFRL
ncbi:hypothetical protein BCLUESOX_2357 [bacterium endosymbiont of Bathymodiolus sp. 5 South]|nr:hypothetical protein BCLUESOX_2357 [bacterium endosymbiont of Bathymodiolus sp. 5 South]VVH56194.1 hypothetical protein BSPCLSOX_2457 [uncultured Gammaproteobacteria bacterium]